MAAEVTKCPDGGTCHHLCDTQRCFRVASCGPLSGVYPDNNWPDDVLAEHIKEVRPVVAGVTREELELYVGLSVTLHFDRWWAVMPASGILSLATTSQGKDVAVVTNPGAAPITVDLSLIKRVTSPNVETQYGVFESDGELDTIERDLENARNYAAIEHGDVIKVRTVTKVYSEWRDLA